MSPASATVQNRTYQTLTFSASNDKSFAVKTYHAELKFTSGLSIVSYQLDPNATVKLNTQKNLIILDWSSIAPGQNLKAEITVYTYNAGTYTISPSTIYYYDYTSRKTYTATCNSANIIYKVNITPPPIPQNIRSISGAGSVTISWDNPSFNYATVNTVYRRTTQSGYTAIASNVYSPHKDTSVVNGETYYYKVAADDTYGNVSGFSGETGETYRALTQKGFYPIQPAAVAVGDVNGDGRPDLIFGGIPYTQGSGKNAVSGAKVDIYFGGNTTGVPNVTLYPPDTGAGFGYSIAVADLNHDGYDDIIIGNPYYNISPPTDLVNYGGRVYVYSGGPQIGTTSLMTITGLHSHGCDNTGCGEYLYIAEQLGYSMAPAGDVNGDGYLDVAIGAPYGGSTLSGSIIILYGGPNLSALGNTRMSGPHSYQYMGYSIAAAGGVNKDGYSDIIAGAPAYGQPAGFGGYGYDPDYPYGSAYLFTGGSYGVQETAAYSTGVQKDWFGIKVSAAGDRNGEDMPILPLLQRTAR